MKKILMFVVMMLMSITAFAGTLDFGTVKGFISIDNILAGIGVVSIAMTATPVPKTGTVLWKVYNIVKYLGGLRFRRPHEKEIRIRYGGNNKKTWPSH